MTTEPMVAEPVTVVPDTDAPEQLLSDEPMFAPPTEPVDAPETEVPQPTPPEPPDYEGLLSDLTDEALENLAPVKSILARKTEATRRSTEAEAARRTFAATQEYAGSEAVIADLTAAARDAAFNLDDNGNPQVDVTKITKANAANLSRGVHVGVNMLSRLLEESTPADFTLTKAETDAIESAEVLYKARPLDPTPLYRAWLTPFQRASTEQMRADVRAELTPQIRREEQERLRATQAEAAGAERATAPRPTALPNGSPSMARAPVDLTTYIGISNALRAGQVSEEAAQQALAKIG